MSARPDVLTAGTVPTRVLAGAAGPERGAPTSSRLTPSDPEMGSLAYMAPEQWSPPIAVGPAADIYALGVLIYEALIRTGTRPHPPYARPRHRQRGPRPATTSLVQRKGEPS